MTMLPCISILQPYAWLIVNGIKPVENRTWPTKFRGRILIHAGVRYPKGDYADDAENLTRRYGIAYPAREDMVGGIVGEAAITDCVTSHPSEYFFGPYGFVMAEPKAYPKPIPYRGQLGIFGVPESALGERKAA
jgi:hypothetical protein